MDRTVQDLGIILTVIVLILIGRRAYRWIRFDDPPYVAHNKFELIDLIGHLAIPLIVLFCFIAAFILNILLPYIFGAGALVILVLIIREIKSKNDDKSMYGNVFATRNKPKKPKKAAVSKKKYKRPY